VLARGRSKPALRAAEGWMTPVLRRKSKGSLKIKKARDKKWLVVTSKI